MAISYVGGVQGGRAGSTSTTTQSLSGTLTGGSNTSPSAGDLVVVWVSVGTAAAYVASSQTISGNNNGAYDNLTFQSQTDTNYSQSQLNYKIQGSTVDTSLTIPSSANARNAQRWIVHVFRGVDATTPLDVTSVPSSGADTGRPDPGAITPTTAGAWIVAFYASAAATGTAYTAPTELVDWLGGTTADTYDCMQGGGYYDSWTSGAYNPQAITAGGTTGTGDSWTATTIALRPIIDPAFSQDAFRLYADGTESGSTALAAQDTNYTADVSGGDFNLGLRVRLQEDNGGAGASTDDYQLQYELNDGGNYYNIGYGDNAIDLYDESNQNATAFLSASTDSRGQTFTGNGSILGAIKLFLSKTNAITGTATVEIYSISGTYGTDSIPTGSVLATSGTFDVSSLTTSVQPVTFYFSGSNQITLTNGSYYALALIYGSGSQLNVGYDSTSPTHSGNMFSRSSGTFSALGSFDLCFYVYDNTSVITNFASTNLTDGGATTNRLGAGTGSFVAGEISEDGLVDDLQITANNYTELLYSLTLVSSALANNDTLDFRVLRNGAVLDTYTVTPRITISAGTPSYTKTHTTNSFLRAKQTLTRTHTTNSLLRKTVDTLGGVSTYYFDGSDAAASDPDNVWTNETNADDGSTATIATSLTEGTVSTNEITIAGTDAPASGGSISAVRVRIYGRAAYNNGLESSYPINASIYTDGGQPSGELLGTATISTRATINWSGYTTLSIPSGGWTWAKIQALETAIYISDEMILPDATAEIARVEIEVTSTGPFAHTTDAYLAAPSTPSYTRTHTTDSLKKVQTTKTHTTNALKRAQATKTHTTDALKKTQTTKAHITDSLKRAQATRAHTTNALLRKQSVKTHTSDALKRLQATRTHTTDTLKKAVATRTHSTDVLKRTQITKQHTTDAYTYRAASTITKAHTSNALLRKANTRTHTSDALKRAQATKQHQTDAYKRITQTKTHTTNALKRAQVTRTHTSDAALVNRYTRTHTVDSLKRAQATKTHSTDALRHATATRTHTANTLLRSTKTTTHTTNALKRQQITKAHTASSYLRATQTFTKTHTTNALKRATATKTHTTNALKRAITTRAHTTNTLLRAQATRAHSTDAFKKTQQTRTHTTNALKRTQQTGYHTTDSFLRTQFSNPEIQHAVDALLRAVATRTHTADTLIRKQQTASHTTNTLKRLQVTKTQTVDALKRATTTKTHTTNSLLRKQTTKAHSTDALKKTQGTVQHTTNTLKRATQTIAHTADSLLRKAQTTVHTTDALKRAQSTASHTTDTSLKEGQQVDVSHTSDALLRAQITTAHTADSLLRTQSTASHTTDASTKIEVTVAHTTDTLLAATGTASHSTDTLTREMGVFTATHATDAFLREEAIPTTRLSVIAPENPQIAVRQESTALAMIVGAATGIVVTAPPVIQLTVIAPPSSGSIVSTDTTYITVVAPSDHLRVVIE